MDNPKQQHIINTRVEVHERKVGYADVPFTCHWETVHLTEAADELARHDDQGNTLSSISKGKVSTLRREIVVKATSGVMPFWYLWAIHSERSNIDRLSDKRPLGC